MSEEIAKVEGTTAIAMPNVFAMQKDSAFAEPEAGIFGSRSGFLPRLNLFTSNSEQCKQGLIPIATYGLAVSGNPTPIALGKQIVAIPLAYRAKAMFLKSDPPLSYFDAKSDKFQLFKSRADADSNSGYMYGPEFLMWLGAQHGYATFFMGSKTARNEAPAVRALMPDQTGRMRVGLFSSVYIEGKEYKWHGPKVELSSQTLEGPPPETLEATVYDFLRPTDSEEVEKAPEGAVQTDR